MAYQSIGVNFNGTDTYLTRGADLTGNADSKSATGAFWVRFNSASASASEFIYAVGQLSLRFYIARTADEEIYIVAKTSGGTIILSMGTSVSAVADTSWHHFMFSFDLTDTAKRHIYLDDSSDLNVSTYTNGTIDFTLPEHEVGAVQGSLLLPGDLADFWLDFGTYIDLSVASNRRKFVGASAATSVDLGSDGSVPTGTAPLIYLHGAVSTWHTNDGTGGGFTENGALTAASTNPPDDVPDPSAFTPTRNGLLVSPGGYWIG